MKLKARNYCQQLPLVSVRFFKLRANPVQFHESPLQLVKEQVDNWSGEQGKRLANHEATDDCDAQWSAQFRSDTHSDGQGHTAEHGSESGHHNWPEAQQRGTINCVYRRQCPARVQPAAQKSIIIMAFLYDQPDERMIPMSAMMLKSVPVISNAKIAPAPARSVERIVNGWMRLSYRMPSTM